jgi:hypothetical protein
MTMSQVSGRHIRRQQPRPHAQFLATTPTVVATLDAVIASVGAGALALHLGASSFALVVVCLTIFLGGSLYSSTEGIQCSPPERGALSVGERLARSVLTSRVGAGSKGESRSSPQLAFTVELLLH